MTVLSGYTPGVDCGPATVDPPDPDDHMDTQVDAEKGNQPAPAVLPPIDVAGPVVARFKAEHWRLAVERTEDPNEFVLSVNQPRWPRHIAARFTVDASGSYRSHQRASPLFFEAEVDDWVRRAVWKVINHKTTGRTVLQW